MTFRSLSSVELAKDALRPFRFEIWREEPNTRDRPYRRKSDHRTTMVWHSLKHSSDWFDVLLLVKRGQQMKIRTYLRRTGYGTASIRMVSVRIINRKKTTK